MRTIEAVVVALAKYLAEGWHLDAAGSGTARWPRTIGLGTVTSAEADDDYPGVMTWAHGWHDWARAHNAQLRLEPRRIRGVPQQLPTHVTFSDVDVAAQAVVSGWPAKLGRARLRARLVGQAFPGVDIAAALRLSDPLDDVDFRLALAAGRWFADNQSLWSGLTPRQVPVVGFHAKWLDAHRPLVTILAGLDDLRLADRGTRVYWTYLDPGYRATRRRIHDSLTLGDSVDLPYLPETVLIVENKDSAILFPEMRGAVVVEGGGNAAVGLIPRVPWIAAVPKVIYWGDIDARGFEIVNGLRERLPRLRSILMDIATFERYEAFSTNVDARGVPLRVPKRRHLPHLTTAERAMYLNVTDPGWLRNRRFEQERIPLGIAVHEAVAAAAMFHTSGMDIGSNCQR